MKIRHPAIIKTVALLGSWIIRGWIGSLNKHNDFGASGELQHPPPPDDGRRVIYSFWHEHLLYCSQFRGKVRVLISNHADGELIAQICHHLRLGTVRGSSRRGGNAALLEMLRAARKNHLVVTPDGPKGPRRQVQAGAIFVASKTGLPILPFGCGFSKAWRAGSWDRTVLPCPFSTGYGIGGKLLHVPRDLDRNGIEHYRRELEDRMHECTEAAERRAAGLPYHLPHAERDEPTMPLATSA